MIEIVGICTDPKFAPPFSHPSKIVEIYTDPKFAPPFSSFHDRNYRICTDLATQQADRISSLYDDVLIHILSFLPTPDAVRTCVLSKRWQYLWPHLRNINFDDVLFLGNGDNARNPRRRLVSVMDGIRNELVFKFQSDMTKLRVSLIFLDHIRLDVWLASAVWRKVQKIDLSLLVGERVTLPDMVFTSQSLTVLKIEMDSVLELPTNISLPCLKTLRLSLVSLRSTELIENLFSSCPALAELALLDCVWTPMKTITISIPTLRTLEIDDDLPSCGSMTAPNGCQMKIYGRNLVSLKYKGALSYEIFLYDISSLVVAEIAIPNLHLTQKETARRGARLLRGVRNVRSVTLSNGAIQSVSLAENFLNHFPIFQKLVHLKLSMVIGAQTMGALMKLFQRTPFLESVVFAMGIDHDTDTGDAFWYQQSALECLTPRLKTVDLHCFCGTKSEINLLKQFLKCVPGLDRMNIHFSKIIPQDLGEPDEILKQLIPDEDPGFCSTVRKVCVCR